MSKENIVTLENPIKRGEQVIEKITLMKPNAGTLRGVSLADVARSEVDALIKVLPRMTSRFAFVFQYSMLAQAAASGRWA